MKHKFAYFFILLSSIIFLNDTIQKIQYSPDDTFIYLQYARNIAAGNGCSFNAGEPSYGVTSPLWVYFLTVPYYLGYDGFMFSKIFDFCFLILSVFVFYRLAHIFWENRKEIALLAVSVFILNAWIVRWSFTGMETSFAVFLVLTVFYLYYIGSYKLLFFTLGAFQLVRPESFVLTAIFFIYILFNNIKYKNFRIKETSLYIICYFILLMPFLLYAYLKFGTILPNTALGKSTLIFSVPTIINQVIEIFKTLSAAGAIEIFLSAVFIVLFIWRDKDEKYFLPAVWIAGLIILYSVTDSDIISRYLLIIVPFFILLGFNVFTKIKKLNPALLIIIYLIFVSFSEFIFYNYVKPHTDNFTKGVNECLIPAGYWLKNNTPPSSKILVNDVGAIGYYSERYIFDAAALINNDPEMNRKIINTPLEMRMNTHMLLDIVKADYVIERDSVTAKDIQSYKNMNFELVYKKEFPGLGIKDDSPKIYKIYKVKYTGELKQF